MVQQNSLLVQFLPGKAFKPRRSTYVINYVFVGFRVGSKLFVHFPTRFHRSGNLLVCTLTPGGSSAYEQI